MVNPLSLIQSTQLHVIKKRKEILHVLAKYLMKSKSVDMKHDTDKSVTGDLEEENVVRSMTLAVEQ